MKKVLTSILVLALVFSCVFAVTANAEDIIDGNTYTAVCGEGSNWAWDATANTLTYNNGMATVTESVTDETTGETTETTSEVADTWTFTFTLSGTNLTWTAYTDNCTSTLDDIIIPSFVKIDDETTYAVSVIGGANGQKTIKSVVIYDGPTKINGSVFENCTALEEITIPETVTEIGSYCFKQDAALHTVNMNAKVKKLGRDTFYKCTALVNITLPDTIETLEQGVFSSCSALAQINFPASLKTIGNTCFSGTALTEITVPATVTTLGTYAFQKCPNLTKAIINCEGLTAIPDGLFSECSSLGTVEYPATVTALGNSAFNKTAITEIDLTGITSIGNTCFFATKLTTVTIPSSVTTIGTNVFRYCASLKSAYIYSEGLETIPGWTFSDCKVLDTIEYPDTVTSFGDYAFYKTNFTTFDFKNVATIGKECFTWAYNANFFVTMPETVTSIGSRAFYRDGFKGMVFLSKVAPTLVGELGSSKNASATIYIPANGVGYDDTFKANFKNSNFVYFGGHISNVAAAEGGYNVDFTIVTVDELGNNTTADLQAKAIVALYDGEGALISTKTVASTDTSVLFETTKTAGFAKIFVIDSITSLKPLYEAHEFTYTAAE